MSIDAPDYVNSGETFRARVTVRNTGTQQWTSNNSYDRDELRSYNGENNTKWGTWRVELPYSPVNPGQTATFVFDVTAPRYAGNQNFDWRMFDQNQGFYGNVCGKNIQVRETYITPPPVPQPLYNDAVCVSMDAPANLKINQNFDARVTLRNVGTKPWTLDGYNAYRLGSQSPQDNQTWGVGRMQLPTGVVYPGQTVTLNRYGLKAPNRNGTFNFDWRMVEEHVQWFGQTCRQTIKVTGAPVVYRTPTPTPYPTYLPTPPPLPGTIICQINGQVYPGQPLQGFYPQGYCPDNTGNSNTGNYYNNNDEDDDDDESWLASIDWAGGGKLLGLLIVIFLICLIIFLLYRIMAVRSTAVQIR